MKTIIINADDFGRSIERNNAIDYAFKHGLIGSAALIVNSLYTQDAVYKAIRGYINHLHCHFNVAGCEIGGYGYPMSDEIKKCPAFCKDGNFRSYGDYDSSNSTLLKYTEEMYRELEAQYKYFIKITNGKANNMHIDFHLWDNQRLPIAAALGRFLRTYKIERCRLVGAHQHYHGIRASLRYFVMRVLSFSPFTKTHSSTRINYYIHRKNEFKSSLIEFYVHPDDIMDRSMIIVSQYLELISTC